MFICEKCLKEKYTNSPSLFQSVGSCEVCEKVRECSDIRCGDLELKKEEPQCSDS